jgi:flagellar biosynthesis protein FliR
VVVAVGLTLIEPAADVDVNVPGVMAILVAPVVAQLSVLLEPEVILVGLAVKESIVGLLGGFTVTVSVDVVGPAALVAVSV